MRSPTSQWDVGGYHSFYRLFNTPCVTILQATKEGGKFNWSEECEKSFFEMKQVLSQAGKISS